MDLHGSIKRLLSPKDGDVLWLWIIALAIGLFWLITASHLWG
jgi:hypothetical protein